MLSIWSRICLNNSMPYYVKCIVQYFWGIGYGMKRMPELCNMYCVMPAKNDSIYNRARKWCYIMQHFSIKSWKLSCTSKPNSQANSMDSEIEGKAGVKILSWRCGCVWLCEHENHCTKLDQISIYSYFNIDNRQYFPIQSVDCISAICDDIQWDVPDRDITRSVCVKWLHVLFAQPSRSTLAAQAHPQAHMHTHHTKKTSFITLQ